MTLKQTITAYLDDTNHETGGWLSGAIAALIALSAVIFVVETYEVSPQVSSICRILDWLILGIFAVEYALRLWTTDRWWSYACSPYGLVDLLAISPFVLGFLDMRFVRLLRWLRILRLIRFLSDRAILGRLTPADTLAVVRIIFTILAIIFIYAGIIFQVEQRYHPETFQTFLDAAYFAVVTMTTVGYGDITPVSDAGRVFTILMILTGIALIPTQLGDLIRRIIKMSQSIQVPCDRCHWPLHDPDAAFCKHCGAALPDSVIRPMSDSSPSIVPSLSFIPRPIVECSDSGWPPSAESPEQDAP